MQTGEGAEVRVELGGVYAAWTTAREVLGLDEVTLTADSAPQAVCVADGQVTASRHGLDGPDHHRSRRREALGARGATAVLQ